MKNVIEIQPRSLISNYGCMCFSGCKSVEEIIDDLRKINFEDLVDNVSQAAEGINDLVSSSAMKESVERFNSIIKDLQELINKTDKLAGNFNAKIDTMANSIESTMGDTSKLLKNIDRRIDPLASGVEKTLATVTLSFTEAEALLVEAQKLISENSRLRREITVTLGSISDASRSVEELSNYLQRHPESLIRGKK